MTTRSLIYCRISDDNTGRAAGVQRQEQDCRAEAARRGWVVSEVIVDNDLSASRYAKRKRPGYTKALEMLRDGSADALVAYHSDRLTRSPRDIEDLIDLAEKRQVTIATLNGDLDLESDNGRAVARIVTAIAAQSSDATSRRVRRSVAQKKAAGKRVWNGAQFGWADETTPDPVQADALRRAYADLLRGRSLSVLCRDFDAAGFVPVRAKRWTITTMKASLLSPANAGLVEQADGTLTTGAFPAIVDRATWERARALLTAPERSKRPRRVTRLTGLVVCGACGAVMKRDVNNWGGVFRCRGTEQQRCGSRVAAEPVETDVWEAVLRLFDDGAPQQAGQHDEALAERTALDDRLAALGRDYADGLVPREAFLAAAEKIQTRKAELAALLAEDTVDRALESYAAPGALRTAYEAGDLDEAAQNMVARAVIDAVVIAPTGKARTGGTASDRISVRWSA